MIEEIFHIEKHTYKDSFIHRLDARVKIILAFAVIIAVVAVPYSTIVYTVGIIFFVFFTGLWILSRLSPAVYLRRLGEIIPLWGIVIFFQIFLKNKYYTEYHAILTLPFGIAIYSESVTFAFILLVKFIISISFIILLSSTTKIQDMLEGATRLGLPADFALVLGMMIRYLFVFGYIYRKMTESLVTRCFDAFDRKLPYRYRIRQLGYTIGTMFIRAYEQGERVYISMLCRGYGRNSYLFVKKKHLKTGDLAFLSVSMMVVIAIPVIVWLAPLRLI
ncbi:MAG: cobalt ECF transporter T component CbiQ [Methanoregula sp.]|jgi:cobalt/nickel transport system permease protein